MKEAFFDCSCLFEETRWHHLVIVIHRNVMRGATASLYIDGAVVDTQKVGRVFSVVTSLLWSPSFLSPPPVLLVFLVITLPCCHFSSVVYCFASSDLVAFSLLLSCNVTSSHLVASCTVTPCHHSSVIVTYTVTPPALTPTLSLL